MAKIPDTSAPAVQPSIRQFTVWTPPLVKSALIMADGGEFRMVADLVDWWLADDRVQATSDTRIGNLIGAPITFEPDGDKRSSARPVHALEDGDFWAIAPEDEHGLWLKWGFALGFCWANLDYSQTRKGRVIPSLRFWHPRNNRYDWDKRQWYARVGDGDSRKEVPIAPGDGSWALFAPYGQFRPWSRGLWRGGALWTIFKSYARDDWGRHSERAATWVATSTELSAGGAVRSGGGAPDATVRNQVVSDIRQMGAMGAIAMPPGVDLKLLEATANTRQMYEAQVDVANVAAAITWLGGNLSTEVKQGSFAAAKAHKTGESGRTKSDAQKESTALHDQVLTWWAQFNYGSRELAPWPKREVDDKEDLQTRADTLQKVSSAATAFKNLGLNVDWEKFAEAFEIPLVEGEDALKESPAPKAPPPAPPQSQPDQQNQPPAPPAPPDKAAKALASGLPLAKSSGFLSGQGYADALVERATPQGADALEPFLAEARKWVDGVKDLETARRKLGEHYRDAVSPEELSNLLEHTWQMGQVAGAAAVTEDTPEMNDGSGSE